MAKKSRYRSEIASAVHEGVRGMHRLGLVDKKTMREFDVRCLTSVDECSPKEIQKLARRHERRARAGRAAKVLLVLGALAGGAFAAWKWWDKQANPDWLVEPPAATEVPESSRLSSVDGSGQALLDPEVQAKEAEEEAAKRDDGR